MRLQKIDETFSGDNWEKETFLTTDDALSVVDWGSSSRLVIRWFLTGGAKWGGGRTFKDVARKVKKNSHISGPNDALNNRYYLWLRPKDNPADLIR